MSEERYYPGCGSYLAALSRFLERKFDEAGYDVQVLDGQQGSRTVRTFQMRKRYAEDWIKTVSSVAGLDTAATVVMKVAGDDDLEVTFGGAKWLDKAAVAGVGVLASLGVLLLPAGIGAWRQRQLLEDLENAVDDFFRQRSR